MHYQRDNLRDAIHTHPVTLIGKWTNSFLLTHPVFLSALSRYVTKLLYFDVATVPRLSSRCLTHPPTVVRLPISVTKWVQMASLMVKREIIYKTENTNTLTYALLNQNDLNIHNLSNAEQFDRRIDNCRAEIGNHTPQFSNPPPVKHDYLTRPQF